MSADDNVSPYEREQAKTNASSTKRCPFCAEEIQAAAIVCRFCHKDLSPLKEAQAATKQQSKQSFAGLGCLGIIVLVVVATCFSSLNKQDEAPKAEAVGAWVVCQDFVKQRLRAPASAKFPGTYPEHTTAIGPDTFRVTASVDSQNGFGALLRTNFICDVKWTGGDNWHLENLNMLPQ